MAKLTRLMQVRSFNAVRFVNSGPSYCCAAIGAALDRRLDGHATYFLRARAEPDGPMVLPLRPRWLNEVGYRVSEPALRRRLETLFLRDLALLAQERREAVVAHLWPSASIELVRGLKSLWVLVVREMINTHLPVARTILEAEHRAIGLPNASPISDAAIASETEVLREVDLILAPSEAVAGSLRLSGVAAGKIARAPFGWDPGRFPEPAAPAPRAAGFTVLFVGSICVRKGSHLLLQAWAESGIAGRLVLCGHVEPTIQRGFGALLRRPDVRAIPFTSRVGEVFRAADAFALPTLEEGAPLVTYEAAGLGLPIVTTAMGTSGVVQDGVNGFVLDAHDKEAWVGRLRALAGSPALRERLGAASREIARASTWDEAAARRLDHFAEADGAARLRAPRAITP